MQKYLHFMLPADVQIAGSEVLQTGMKLSKPATT